MRSAPTWLIRPLLTTAAGCKPLVFRNHRGVVVGDHRAVCLAVLHRLMLTQHPTILEDDSQIATRPLLPPPAEGGYALCGQLLGERHETVPGCGQLEDAFHDLHAVGVGN